MKGRKTYFAFSTPIQGLSGIALVREWLVLAESYAKASIKAGVQIVSCELLKKKGSCLPMYMLQSHWIVNQKYSGSGFVVANRFHLRAPSSKGVLGARK